MIHVQSNIIQNKDNIQHNCKCDEWRHPLFKVQKVEYNLGNIYYRNMAVNKINSEILVNLIDWAKKKIVLQEHYNKINNLILQFQQQLKNENYIDNCNLFHYYNLGKEWVKVIGAEGVKNTVEPNNHFISLMTQLYFQKMIHIFGNILDNIKATQNIYTCNIKQHIFFMKELIGMFCKEEYKETEVLVNAIHEINDPIDQISYLKTKDKLYSDSVIDQFEQNRDDNPIKKLITKERFEEKEAQFKELINDISSYHEIEWNNQNIIQLLNNIDNFQETYQNKLIKLNDLIACEIKSDNKEAIQRLIILVSNNNIDENNDASNENTVGDKIEITKEDIGMLKDFLINFDNDYEEFIDQKKPINKNNNNNSNLKKSSNDNIVPLLQNNNIPQTISNQQFDQSKFINSKSQSSSLKKNNDGLLNLDQQSTKSHNEVQNRSISDNFNTQKKDTTNGIEDKNSILYISNNTQKSNLSLQNSDSKSSLHNCQSEDYAAQSSSLKKNNNGLLNLDQQSTKSHNEVQNQQSISDNNSNVKKKNAINNTNNVKNENIIFKFSLFAIIIMLFLIIIMLIIYYLI